MKIDWTISASNLIAGGVFLAAILYKMSKMETKVDAMWSWFLSQTPGVTRSSDPGPAKIFERIRERDQRIRHHRPSGIEFTDEDRG